LRLLAPEIERNKGALATCAGCMALSALCVMALPRWIAWLLKGVLPAGDTGLVLRALGLGLGLICLAALLAFGRDYFSVAVCLRMVARLRAQLFERLLQLPWRLLSERAAGDMISRYSNDLSVLQQALIGSASTFIPNALFLAVLAGCMFWYSWQLSLVVACLIPPLAAAIHYFGHRIYTAVHGAQAQAADLTALLGESIDGAKEIKSFTREELVLDRFARLNENALESSLREQRMFSAHTPAVLVLTTTMIVLLILAQTLLFRHRLATSENLISFIACVALVIGPVGEVARTVGFFSRIAAILARVDEILSAPHDETERERSRPPLPAVRGRITFERVGFVYGADGADGAYGANGAGGFALHAIDLEIAEFETVAIVGPSGAGKTTLLNLLPRFIKPTAGVIRIDGYDIAGCGLESLRNQIGIVTQEPFLFQATLRENLLFGKLDATPRQIEAAARAAHLEEFVARLPLGYETPVGPRGSTLSAGQRQRLAIARALLKNAPILLLDEPTSALDPESEELVRDALDHARQNRTTLIVAHRLTTIRNADRVVTLDRGRITAIFSREDWLAKTEPGPPAESLA
jgi:subfamily B ATP-binding cassette protein MsbA